MDPNAIPSSQYEQPGFNPLPAQIPGGFDAPRTRAPGQAWWETWNFFRAVMIWRYNIDFARYITTTMDPETRVTVPTGRWFSHQIPGGKFTVTLTWSGSADLDLYLTPVDCTGYPPDACLIYARSQASVGNRETIEWTAGANERFRVWVDNFSPTTPATYTIVAAVNP